MQSALEYSNSNLAKLESSLTAWYGTDQSRTKHVDYPDTKPTTRITYLLTNNSGRVLLTVLRTVEEITAL